ncbi:unnamed protein product [Chironomus riparius]|uniref:Ionotropic receptor n=1 Tax=Chironomus riparius TaxID=315576 RepID=A0A9N9S1S8_9DIPT|nr:unnamed protein product [Chironomus riparius]
MNNILSNINSQNFPIEQISIKNAKNWSCNISQSALIIIDNFDDLCTFNNQTNLNNRFPKQLKFLVYVDEFQTDNFINMNLPQKLSYFYGNIAFFQYLMIKTIYQTISLFTIKWFLPHNCNKPFAIQENYFDLITRRWKWDTDLMDINYHNFYGCTLQVGLLSNFRDFGYKDKFDRKIKGSLVSLYKIIGEKGNFKPNYLILDPDTNSTFILDKYSRNLLDVFIDIKSVAVTSHHVTTTFNQIEIIFMITPSQKYTNFEKMVMPFDRITWIFLAVTFLIAFFVIFFVNRLSFRYQVMIYGEGVKMPALNIVRTFFGIGQARLPFSNFPRIILIFFVYFCLVIRTAYQGVSYYMLTNDIRRPAITQIKDLFENNYTVCTINSAVFTTALKRMVENGSKISSENFPIEQISIKNPKNWSYKINQSALIIVKRFNELYTFNHRTILNNRFPKLLKFLVYVDDFLTENAVYLDLQQKLSSYHGDIACFEYIMVRNNYQTVSLLTIDWYTPESCNNPIASRINLFDLLSRTWTLKIDSMTKKFHNFHECTLLVGSFYKYLKYAFKDKIDGKIKGSLVSLFKILGEKSNFIPSYQLLDEDSSSNLKKDSKFRLNVFIEIKSVGVTTHHVTTTFSQIDMIFMITPSQKYTNFEKMVMPFDCLTWIFLFTTFFAAFFVIFFVNRLSMKYQVILYGEGVKMPAFNIVGTFFGIGQTRLPMSNFPRMILIFFVYFCLVIRTAYQGVSYYMLTNDLRRPVITQIKDLLENNYTIYTISPKEFVVPLRQMIENGTK